MKKKKHLEKILAPTSLKRFPSRSQQNAMGQHLSLHALYRNQLSIPGKDIV